MIVVGVLLLVGLLAAAGALWFAAGEREADNVATFARAPVGCDTTLDFESTGTFLLYVETTGEFEQLAGECDAEFLYDRDPADVPAVDLTLRGPGGDEIEIDETTGVEYDVDGFVGSSIGEVQIETTGDHVLTVAPTDGDSFAIAVGRQPDEGVALLRWGAVAAAIAGLLVGGLFLVLGSRRPPAPATPAAPWTPDGQNWPASPPGFPVPPPTTGAVGPVGSPFPTPPTFGPSPFPPSQYPPAPTVPPDGPRGPWAPPAPPQ
jgi:hypothetical protein